MYVEGIGSLPQGRRKRNSCSLLSFILLSSLFLSPRLPLALWYPSSLLSRNLFVISSQICLCWLNSPSSYVGSALASIPQSTALSARDDQTHSQALTPESAATCMHCGWLWGPGLQVAEGLVEQVSDVLLQILFSAHTVCQWLQSNFLKKMSFTEKLLQKLGKKVQFPSDAWVSCSVLETKTLLSWGTTEI